MEMLTDMNDLVVDQLDNTQLEMVQNLVIRALNLTELTDGEYAL